MNAPTFRVGEEIYSKDHMGKIQFAHWSQDNTFIGWYYVLEQPIAHSHRYDFLQIKESDVICVWRDGRWTGK